MTSPVWITPKGFLGTLTERQSTSVDIVATGTNISYSIISGDLPNGLQLDSLTGIISGTPSSVPQITSSTFVIRVANTSGISDRTFSLDVSGVTAPIWDTPSGALPVGPTGEFYTLNKEYVDYTVRAETDILVSGNTLKYYIADNAGQLPPGLTLTQSGRIVGYVNDQLKLNSQASVSGGYDTDMYDGYPYDHSLLDVQLNQLVLPESISKTYQFTITVTDGIVSASREFNIKVQDPNSLRVDNSMIDVDTTIYSADSGYLVAPLWQNRLGQNLPHGWANLGTIRAGREQIITLHDYDPYPFTGPVTFDWGTTVNPEVQIITQTLYTISEIPESNLKNQNYITIANPTVVPVSGMYLHLSEYLPNATPTTYLITGVIRDTVNNVYRINLNQTLKDTIPDSKILFVGNLSQHPTGMSLDTKSGQLHGIIPFQPLYSKTYKFTIKVIKTDFETGNTVYSNQMFMLTVQGDIYSSIEWTSTSTLGTLIPGQVSELAVTAVDLNTNYSLEYQLVSGTLPPGLTLYSDGSIQGTIPNQSSTGTTTYNFIAQANDVYQLNAIQQTFTIKVSVDTTNPYTQIYVQPFLPSAKRISYSNFISDPTIFDLNNMYRPNDTNFGIQPIIKMMIEFGIQSIDNAVYSLAIQNYFSRRQFYFGEVKSIVAQDKYRNPVYELVYIDIIDTQMSGNSSPTEFTYEKFGYTNTYTPSTVGTWQHTLETIQLDNNLTIDVDDRLQPRFMTTIQSTTGLPIGFVKAVVLCYTLPGKSAKVLSRIASSGFNFNSYNFDVDRIIIDNTLGTDTISWIPFQADLFPGYPVLETETGNIITTEDGNPLEGNQND